MGLSSSADSESRGIGEVERSEKAFLRKRTVVGVLGDSGLRSSSMGVTDLNREQRKPNHYMESQRVINTGDSTTTRCNQILESFRKRKRQMRRPRTKQKPLKTLKAYKIIQFTVCKVLKR